MNCYKHPDKESSVNCSLCGEPICEECLVEIAGRRMLSGNCGTSILQRLRQQNRHSKHYGKISRPS